MKIARDGKKVFALILNAYIHIGSTKRPKDRLRKIYMLSLNSRMDGNSFWDDPIPHTLSFSAVQLNNNGLPKRFNYFLLFLSLNCCEKGSAWAEYFEAENRRWPFVCTAHHSINDGKKNQFPLQLKIRNCSLWLSPH